MLVLANNIRKGEQETLEGLKTSERPIHWQNDIYIYIYLQIFGPRQYIDGRPKQPLLSVISFASRLQVGGGSKTENWGGEASLGQKLGGNTYGDGPPALHLPSDAQRRTTISPDDEVAYWPCP